MIFSIKNNICYFYQWELFVLEYSQDENDHVWKNCQIGKAFDMRIPKKYYNERQALNKAKVWAYELLLEAKRKKTVAENN